MASERILELLRRPVDADEYQEIRELWKTHSLAEDNRDLPGLISTLTEDCVYEVMGTGARWEGHDGATRFYTELLTAFPDIHFDLEYIVIGPQGVCEEARVTATHEGRWLDHEPSGDAPRVAECDLLPLGSRREEVPRRDGLHRSQLAGSDALAGERAGRLGELAVRAARDREERIDDVWMELRAAASADVGEGILDGEGIGVRAHRGHRVPGVGEADDRRLDRDLGARQTVGIAASVEALVVMADAPAPRPPAAAACRRSRRPSRSAP